MRHSEFRHFEKLEMAPSIVRIRRNFMFVALIEFVSYFDTVDGYYCEWNLCEGDQYCCGENQCCNNVYSLWYFWAGIVFVVLMLLSFGGFFRYCYAYRPQIVVHQITNFMPVTSDRACPEEMQGLVAYEDFETLQSYPTETEVAKSKPVTLFNVNYPHNNIMQST